MWPALPLWRHVGVNGIISCRLDDIVFYGVNTKE